MVKASWLIYGFYLDPFLKGILSAVGFYILYLRVLARRTYTQVFSGSSNSYGFLASLIGPALNPTEPYEHSAVIVFYTEWITVPSETIDTKDIWG